MRWKIEINTKTAGNSGFARFGYLAQFKIGLVLGMLVFKSKNWEGFPQTSQRRRTLTASLPQNPAKNET